MYEDSLCICCMATESLEELFEPKICNDTTTSYPEMLRSCLNIQISEADGHNWICTVCSARLRDCAAFRAQALRSIAVLSSEDERRRDMVKMKLLMKAYTEYSTIDKLNVDAVDQCMDYSSVLEVPTAETDNQVSEIKPSPTTLKKRKNKTKQKQAALGKKTKRTGLRKEQESVENSSKKECEDQKYLVNSQAATISPSPKQENNKPASNTESMAPEGIHKRKRGRPRVRESLPYKIGKDELKCRECNEEFPFTRSLMVHYNTHFPNYMCGECNKGFITLGSLKRHEKTHEAGPFTCNICQKVFNNYNTLHSHRRYSHKPLPYRCGECGEGFPTRFRRLHHLATSHGKTEKPHKCPYCGEHFKTSDHRYRHVQYHHEPVMQLCAACGLRCRHSYLSRHEALHRSTDGDGWRCAVCDQLCTRRNMAPHIMGHLRERRYECKLCSASYKEKYSVMRHIASQHAGQGQLLDEELVHDTAAGLEDTYTGILPPPSPSEPASLTPAHYCEVPFDSESHEGPVDFEGPEGIVDFIGREETVNSEDPKDPLDSMGSEAPVEDPDLASGDIDTTLLEDDRSLPSDWDFSFPEETHTKSSESSDD